ncbi:hypothetical protein GCM10008966_33170 [Rhodovulum strictum]
MHAAAEIDRMALLDAVDLIDLDQRGIDLIHLPDTDGGHHGEQHKNKAEAPDNARPERRVPNGFQHLSPSKTCLCGWGRVCDKYVTRVVIG